MQRCQHRRRVCRKPWTTGPGITQAYSEIVPQGELHLPGIAGSKYSSEERAEVGVGAGDSPVGMVEQIEALRAELDGAPLGHAKAPRERRVEDVVAGSGDDIAAGIAKGEQRRRRECRSVKELVRRAQAARKGDALAGNDIGTVRSAGVGKVQREIERVNGRAILQG